MEPAAVEALYQGLAAARRGPQVRPRQLPDLPRAAGDRPPGENRLRRGAVPPLRRGRQTQAQGAARPRQEFTVVRRSWCADGPLDLCPHPRLRRGRRRRRGPRGGAAQPRPRARGAAQADRRTPAGRRGVERPRQPLYPRPPARGGGERLPHGGELDPQRVSALFNLGLLLQERSAPREALRLFREVVEIQPEHAWAHYQIGALYEVWGQSSKAVASTPAPSRSTRSSPFRRSTRTSSRTSC